MPPLKLRASEDSSWISTLPRDMVSRRLDELTEKFDNYIWEVVQWLIRGHSSGLIRFLLKPREIYKLGLEIRTFEAASLLGKLVLLYGAVPSGVTEFNNEDVEVVAHQFRADVRKEVRPKIIAEMGKMLKEEGFSSAQGLLSLWREHLANQGRHIRGSQLLETLDNIVLT